ncbi:hypothetical protein M422DRAFT_56389 [Sphaerobolus stellatus SS14]|uniref:Uncharacterized protein n=1 Tax=Sphaerobolus stellatus (strain SS14) TaxID=990650 RepID=A0A0C9T6H0_SPHS4|nr:hypothetical protein M422DRAFT_56389 [Sphaerobolus stellatus SS14]
MSTSHRPSTRKPSKEAKDFLTAFGAKAVGLVHPRSTSRSHIPVPSPTSQTATTTQTATTAQTTKVDDAIGKHSLIIFVCNLSQFIPGPIPIQTLLQTVFSVVQLGTRTPGIKQEVFEFAKQILRDFVSIVQIFHAVPTGTLQEEAWQNLVGMSGDEQKRILLSNRDFVKWKEKLIIQQNNIMSHIFLSDSGKWIMKMISVRLIHRHMH